MRIIPSRQFEMTAKRMLCVLCLFGLIVSPSVALSSGAPLTACETMMPQHQGTPAQTSASPYSLSVRQQKVAQGGKVRVIIDSPLGLAFQGFVLQAHSKQARGPIGSFGLYPDVVKPMNCFENFASSLTHKSSAEKKKLEFEWTSPDSDKLEEMYFNATVLQDYQTFWTNIISDPVRVVRNAAELGDLSSVGISTTHEPVVTDPPSSTRSTTPPPVNNPEMDQLSSVRALPIYSGCGVTKACFGTPSGCVDSTDCTAMVTILVQGSQYTFEMMARDSRYVAFGLSDDDVMGSDSVLECAVDEGNKVGAYLSWNEGKKNARLAKPQVGINLLSGSYVDGNVNCTVTRDEETVIVAPQTGNSYTYNLANRQYFALLAAGSSVHPNNVAYHDKAYVPSSAANFLSDVYGFSAKSKLLLRLHGAFMIAAWIGTAGLGILFARYYKQTWVQTQMCGKDMWFTWHRTFMVLTWLLTMAGFILIFVELKAWSSERNPHAILGLVTTILTFFQPIGAAFRPHPGTRRRPLFNWLHWLVGNVAHIIAIVTIFFAIKLSKAELPEWLNWVLVGYVGFHVIAHLILSVGDCISERQGGARINTFPMKDMSSSRNPLQTERKHDAPLAAFRKVMLGIYIVVILALVTAIIVIAVWAPIEENWHKTVLGEAS